MIQWVKWMTTRNCLHTTNLSGNGPLLGIVPINENNLCRWGCVDIDEYNLDFKKIIDRVKNLPAQLFRSKSGGGHLFIFTKEWVPASLLRSKLKMLAAFVGKSGAEIMIHCDEYYAVPHGMVHN